MNADVFDKTKANYAMNQFYEKNSTIVNLE